MSSPSWVSERRGFLEGTLLKNEDMERLDMVDNYWQVVTSDCSVGS